jgi:hypothetical protein
MTAYSAQALVQTGCVCSTERCARLRGADCSLTFRGQALGSSVVAGLFSGAQNWPFYDVGGER